VPVIVGSGLAMYHDYDLNLLVMAATLAAAVMIQVATNLYNDAFDAIRGVDDPRHRLGPPRAVASGWLTARQVMRAAHAALVCAFALGIGLVIVGGWPILALGLAAMLAAWAYSAGPAPISHGPVGELFVLLFFGLAAVTGTYYLQTGRLDADAALCGVVLGMPATAVLLVNNYRDMTTDRAAGRRTLAIVAGPRATRLGYAGLLLLTPVFATALIDSGRSPLARWLPLLLLPWALYLARRLAVAPIDARLNRMLAATAGYQVALGALLCAGWWLSAAAVA